MRANPPFVGKLAVLWLLVMAANLAMVFGALRINFDDGLARVFESSNPAYAQYQEFLDTFEVSEGDLLVVFTGDDFADPVRYGALREFVFEVQFEPGIGGILSPFSFDLPPPGTPDLAQVMDRLWLENPGFRRFMSRERTVAMVALAPALGPHDEAARPLAARVREIARATTGPAGIVARITGYPALRDNVIRAVFGDFVTNTVIGVAVGSILSVLALRSVALAAMVTLTSGVALLWMLGLFGFAGLTIDVVTISLPVLILVLSFASAIHLTFEVRRQARAGEAGAVRAAVRRIGPACVLTTLTTAAAFASLMTSPSALINNMGQAGVVATFASLAGVFAMLPLLLATAARWPGLGRLFAGRRGQAAKVWNLRFLQDWAARWPGAISVMSVLLMAAAVAVYARVEAVYSLYDHVATDSEAYQALITVEEELAPIGTIAFALDLRLDTPGAMEVLRRAQAALVRNSGGLEAVSIADFVRPGADPATALEALPEVLRARLVSRAGQMPVIVLLVPNEGAGAVRKLVTRLEAGLAADPDWPGDIARAPTGLLVTSSFLSEEMLLDLNRCFLVAVIVSGLVVALWLRNPVIGLVALIPNVLPVALVGAWLTLSGAGLEFSSGIALTIAFGLAIDDTIHVLNRLRLDGGPGQLIGPALIRSALARVSPALVITSGVLSFGLIGTQVGQLPLIAYFGRLSVAAFVLALVADLLVLPALLLTLTRIVPSRFLRIHR